MGMIYLGVQHCSKKAVTDLILSHMNADHTLASYFFVIHLILSSHLCPHFANSTFLNFYWNQITGNSDIPSQVWVGTEFPLRLDYGRSPYAYVTQRLQIQLELLMMSGVLPETCSAFSKWWNNKFYYKVASCGLFLLSHTTMHGSMNIKSTNKYKDIILCKMSLVTSCQLAELCLRSHKTTQAKSDGNCQIK
jgi:hypothetical protein